MLLLSLSTAFFLLASMGATEGRVDVVLVTPVGGWVGKTSAVHEGFSWTFQVEKDGKVDSKKNDIQHCWFDRDAAGNPIEPESTTCVTCHVKGKMRKDFTAQLDFKLTSPENLDFLVPCGDATSGDPKKPNSGIHLDCKVDGTGALPLCSTY